MAEILVSTNEQNQPSQIYRAILKLLANKLLQENCVIFLGAGASVDPSKPHLLSAKELSKEMADECNLEWHEYIPLSTIAFYYESFSFRELLNEFLKTKISGSELGFKIEPSTAINILIDIISILEEKNKRILVVTTNYDQQFEYSYKNAFGEFPEIVIYNGGLDPNRNDKEQYHIGLDDQYTNLPEGWAPQKKTCLYKMHGCISHAKGQNLVVTEEDYINFLTTAMGQDNGKKMLRYVTGKMGLSHILFVGHSLSDWNLRVIYKALKESMNMTSYAVQRHDRPPEDQQDSARWNAVVGFWEDKDVRIFNADASVFMEHLLMLVREVAPQY